MYLWRRRDTAGAIARSAVFAGITVAKDGFPRTPFIKFYQILPPFIRILGIYPAHPSDALLTTSLRLGEYTNELFLG